MMTNTEKRADFFYRVCQLVINLKQIGITVAPVSFYRTPEQQQWLYQEGKSLTLNSKHVKWLAIDLAIVENGTFNWTDIEKYKTIGTEAKKLGLAWGGDFKKLNDMVHIEYPER